VSSRHLSQAVKCPSGAQATWSYRPTVAFPAHRRVLGAPMRLVVLVAAAAAATEPT
jgi:hypothetical protein